MSDKMRALLVAFISALFSIYETAGREVTYITDRGEVRPYWANRFRQALQRAVDAEEVLAFVERLILQPEPSRGFFYLKDAGRLDLTVEALVVDPEFQPLFSQEVIDAARERLLAHGYVLPQASGTAPTPPTAGGTEASAARSGAGLQPGMTLDVRVTVAADGSLTFKLA